MLAIRLCLGSTSGPMANEWKELQVDGGALLHSEPGKRQAYAGSLPAAELQAGVIVPKADLMARIGACLPAAGSCTQGYDGDRRLATSNKGGPLRFRMCVGGSGEGRRTPRTPASPVVSTSHITLAAPGMSHSKRVSPRCCTTHSDGAYVGSSQSPYMTQAYSCRGVVCCAGGSAQDVSR